jgi:hypothetical protein
MTLRGGGISKRSQGVTLLWHADCCRKKYPTSHGTASVIPHGNRIIKPTLCFKGNCPPQPWARIPCWVFAFPILGSLAAAAAVAASYRCFTTASILHADLMSVEHLQETTSRASNECDIVLCERLAHPRAPCRTGKSLCMKGHLTPVHLCLSSAAEKCVSVSLLLDRYQ